MEVLMRQLQRFFGYYRYSLRLLSTVLKTRLSLTVQETVDTQNGPADDPLARQV